MSQASERRALAEQWLRHHGPLIGQHHTLAWSGPWNHVREQWPDVAAACADIQDRVPQHVPIWFFQGRTADPPELIVAVPFADEQGRGPNVRLLPNRPLSPSEIMHFNHFSQAAWVAIEEGLLPAADEETFRTALVHLAGERLLE